MQLSNAKQPKIRSALAAASCTLLGLTAQSVEAAPEPANVDSALLFYNEADRVNVTAATALITKPLEQDEVLTITPTFDTISGASPTGATPTASDPLPTEKISDLRFAIAFAYQHALDRLNRRTLGANFSIEQDYSSAGLSYIRERDINNKLTTLAVGLSGSLDTIFPTTGVVNDGLTPLSADSLTRASGATNGGGGEDDDEEDDGEVATKVNIDGMVGITQVVNRRMLVQLNYSLGLSNGYLTDPYKIISSVDGSSGATLSYVTEKRPDSRWRQSIYTRAVLHLPEDVIHFSYRYYFDEWGIDAHTFELKYHFTLADGAYLQPEARYYSQSAADFFYYSLIEGEPLPEYASADYRLARMNSLTYGLKFAMPIGKSGEFSTRAAYMKQTGESHPDEAIGEQRLVDLYPGLEAYIVQLGLAFKF